MVIYQNLERKKKQETKKQNMENIEITKIGGEKSRYAKKIEKKEKHQDVHIVKVSEN